MKHAIRTHPGNKLVDLLDPQPEDIDLRDIIQGLAAAARWRGFTRPRFNVLHHTLLCVNLAPPGPRAIEALLHDTPEYLLGDAATPFKTMIPDYEAIEHRLLGAIYKHFGLTAAPMSPTMKLIDRAAAQLERMVTRGEKTFVSGETLASDTCPALSRSRSRMVEIGHVVETYNSYCSNLGQVSEMLTLTEYSIVKWALDAFTDLKHGRKA